MIEFNNAIETALKKIDMEETLVVVTADHSHTLTLAGYSTRGYDIFKTAGMGDDKLPYFTLSYANGPGYDDHRIGSNRVNASTLNTSSINFQFPATVQLSSETHSAEDVR
ncbi:hypothetical protein PVAND_012963 [Polypedilum vanderplanki]|uniref:alkaline phosphatase n=1 Tax=Polypedilum vanderplanki TaxID=319348 RepID=A0A9J6CN88_POLVA|nr:hypothetical protein PVAND_012963 [Polypedilum vanderplanki]